jgi:hypothetical protein
MNALLRRGFSCAHAGSRLPGSAPAAFLLYLRGHYLRMPPQLLLPHLVVKAWMRWQDARKARTEEQAPTAG